MKVRRGFSAEFEKFLPHSERLCFCGVETGFAKFKRVLTEFKGVTRRLKDNLRGERLFYEH